MSNISFEDNNINFDENNLENNLEDNKIIIFTEQRGRKTNTYIIDWNIDNIKEHLKNLKRKHGCNGSIKKINYQGEEIEVLHLQGNWKKEVKNYLLELNILENNIEVKV